VTVIFITLQIFFFGVIVIKY